MHILKFRVNSLFGKYSVELDLTQKANILYGANGVGKTTLLRMYTCLLNNDFVEILRWNFQSIEIVALEHENHNHIDSKIERSFFIMRTDLLPEPDKMAKLFAKSFIRNWRYYRVDLNEIDLEEVDRKEEQVNALFDELISYNLYHQYLCDCLFGLPHSQQIKEVVQHHDYSGSIYNEYMPIAMKDLLGTYRRSIRYLSFSHFYALLGDRELGLAESCVDDGRNGFKRTTYYIDLVKGFDFTCPVLAETVYFSETLRWISQAKKIWGFGDEEYRQKERSIEETILYLSGEDNLLHLSPYISHLSGTIYKEFLYEVFYDINDFTSSSIEMNGNEYSITEKLLKDFIDKREININALISANYYRPGIAKEINKRSADFYNRVLLGKIYWDIDDEEYSWIDRKDKEKYEYEYMGEFLEQYFRDEENIDLINTYIRPIVCEDFVVSPKQCFISLKNIGSDKTDSNLYLCYLYYKEILSILVDEGNKNPRIGQLEKLLNKYFYDKEVRILPSGIFVKSKEVDADSNILPFNKFKNDYIDLNHLSSGEKKILLLLTLMMFFDGLSVLLDEPELSLSIVWQESLLEDIIDNGSFENILVATHSPYMAMNETVQQYMVFIPDEDKQ